MLGHPFSLSLETGGSLPGRNFKTKGSPGRGITYRVLGNPQGTGKWLKAWLGPKAGRGGSDGFSAGSCPGQGGCGTSSGTREVLGGRMLPSLSETTTCLFYFFDSVQGASDHPLVMEKADEWLTKGFQLYPAHQRRVTAHQLYRKKINKLGTSPPLSLKNQRTGLLKGTWALRQNGEQRKRAYSAALPGQEESWRPQGTKDSSLQTQEQGRAKWVQV